MATANSSFIYIIKTGSTTRDIAGVQGDFEDWIRVGLLTGLAEAEGTPSIQVIDARGEGQIPATLPLLSHCAGIVITGSHAMVTEAAAWMVELER